MENCQLWGAGVELGERVQASFQATPPLATFASLRAWARADFGPAARNRKKKIAKKSIWLHREKREKIAQK